MTAQIREILYYEGEQHRMCTEPLAQYFSLGGEAPKFVFRSTANWRGYLGKWEILNDRLYLTSLEGMLEDGSDATLAVVFPGFPDRVFAHWFTGSIRISQGRLLRYEHMGYESVYERDLLLSIRKGILVGSHVCENGN